MFKQNKGVSPKHMPKGPNSKGSPAAVRHGTPCIEMRGTFVHADTEKHLGHESEHNGSHDHVYMEHADHKA